MTQRVLVTGASGTVGSGVLRVLRQNGITAIAGLRSIPIGEEHQSAQVDFEKGIGPSGQFDALFLMRPPHLTDPGLFTNFLDRFSRDTRVVFLSVQGADNMGFLPHAKIERVISEMGFQHVFVRPSYFMDNLTTTLWPELQRNKRIYLPAGRLKLDWVSARDVAEVCASAIAGSHPEPVLQATGGQVMGFDEVCTRINATLGTSFRYAPASLVGYLAYNRSQGATWSYLMVMLLLHFLPRLTGQPHPHPSDLPAVLNRDPETVEAFALRHAKLFRSVQ